MAGKSSEAIGLGTQSLSVISGSARAKADAGVAGRGSIDTFIGYRRDAVLSEQTPDDFNATDDTITECKSGASVGQKPVYTASTTPGFSTLTWTDVP